MGDGVRGGVGANGIGAELRCVQIVPGHGEALPDGHGAVGVTPSIISCVAGSFFGQLWSFDSARPSARDGCAP